MALENIDAIRYSPADKYLVTCEKFNQNNPDNTNLRIVDTQSGRHVASFVWRKSPKEGLRTIMWNPDESICLRMAPPEGPGQPNQIEIYRNGDFSQPTNRIFARFP